ncbi:ZRAB3 endonuclease, partial [Atractosteus spatula]|nr:ZRAB3 endonuclease [Atractosteus spatula]
MAEAGLEQLEQLDSGELDSRLATLPDRLRRRLLPFQREGVTFALSRRGRCMIADEMGLGKTIQAISVALLYKQEWPLLVVVPSSMRYPWVEEMEKWIPELNPDDINLVESKTDTGTVLKLSVVVYKKATPFNGGLIEGEQALVLRLSRPRSTALHQAARVKEPKGLGLSGDVPALYRAPGFARIPTSRVTVLGYGLLTSDAKLLLGALEAQSFRVVIVDESHYLKSRTAARTKILVPLIQKASRAVLLTGTPALGRPEELFMQIDALYPRRFGSWSDYAAKYCNAHFRFFGNRRQWDCRGASNLGELHQRLSEMMIRRLKDEVLTQLPPKIRQRIPFDLPKEGSKEACASFEEWEKLMRTLDAGTAGTDNPFVEVMGLVTRMYKQTAIAKAGAVKDYIKMMLENEKLKFLVFAHHLAMLQACTEAVIEAKIRRVLCRCLLGLRFLLHAPRHPFTQPGKWQARYIRIDGSVPSSERIHLVHQFQSDPDTRVAVLSIQAAGQGLTFTAATHVVFAELYWDPGHIKQAEDRAHRIGQSCCVHVHYLIAKGTFDTVMWGMLNRKAGSTLNGKKEYLKAELGDREKWEFLSFASAWTPAHARLSPAQQARLSLQFEKEKQRDIRTFFLEKKRRRSAEESLSEAAAKGPAEEEEEPPAAVAREEAAVLPEPNGQPHAKRPRGSSRARGPRPPRLSEGDRPASGEAPSSGEEWRCSCCTFANSPLLPYCEMCEAPRPRHAHGTAQPNTETHLKLSSRIKQQAKEIVSVGNRASAAVLWSLTTETFSSLSRLSWKESCCRRESSCPSQEPLSEPQGAEERRSDTEGRDDPPPHRQHACRTESGRREGEQGAGSSGKTALSHNETECGSADSTIPVQEGLKFCASRNTDRIYLYSKDGVPLNCNFIPLDIKLENWEDLPEMFQHPENRQQVLRFVRAWSALTAMKQRVIRRSGRVFLDPRAALEDIGGCQRRHSSTKRQGALLGEGAPPAPGVLVLKRGVKESSDRGFEQESARGPPPAVTTPVPRHGGGADRYLTKEDVAQASLRKVQKDGGFVRVIARENPFLPKSKTNQVHQTDEGRSGDGAAEDRASSSAGPPEGTGYLQALGRDGAPLCLCCLQPCPQPAPGDSRFCSQDCQEDFLVRSSQAHMRARVLATERGVCQQCGLGAQELYQRVRDAPPARRKEILESSSLAQLPLRQLNEIIRDPAEGQFWQVDHIRPVYGGGGQCSLDNLQTLCTLCHRKRTAQQAKERSQMKRSVAASKLASDITRFFIKK